MNFRAFGFSLRISNMKYSNNQLLQGGIVGTMTGSCLFYDITGTHMFRPDATFSLFPSKVNFFLNSV